MSQFNKDSLKQFGVFVLFQVIFRALVACPLVYALKSGKFEILAIVSFAMTVIGPWEAWQFLQRHGFKGFGIEIVGNIWDTVEKKDQLIKEQDMIIQTLKDRNSVLSQELDGQQKLSVEKERTIKLFQEKLTLMEKKVEDYRTNADKSSDYAQNATVEALIKASTKRREEQAKEGLGIKFLQDLIAQQQKNKLSEFLKSTSK